MNEDGLFLNAKKKALVVNENRDDFIKVGYDENGHEISNFPDILSRVEISWDGLILRNWNNENVFYADPNTGDLNIKGRLTATELYITVDEGIDIGNNTTTTEPDILSYLNAKGLNKLAQVTVNNDPNSDDYGKINLSSLGFDSEGIKSSKVEIVPSGITIKSKGSISMNSSTLAMTGSSISMTGGNISLTGNNSITLTSSGSVVSISPSQINLNSGSIIVKGLPIWERNDIIYDYYDPRRSGAPISPPSKRAWLWVKPIGRDIQ
jgi:hypothetical protein